MLYRITKWHTDNERNSVPIVPCFENKIAPGSSVVNLAATFDFVLWYLMW